MLASDYPMLWIWFQWTYVFTFTLKMGKMTQSNPAMDHVQFHVPLSFWLPRSYDIRPPKAQVIFLSWWIKKKKFKQSRIVVAHVCNPSI